MNAVLGFLAFALLLVNLATVLKTRKLTEQIMSAMEDLTREVAEVKTAGKSAAVLLKGLKDKLDAAIATGNMAAVQALADDLNATETELVAAVTENTPVEEPPVP